MTRERYHKAEIMKLSGLNGVLAWAYGLACILYNTKYPDEPQPFIDTAYRSPARQNELYAQGRTKPGKIVTNAMAGQSKHNTYPSKAFDVKFIDNQGAADWEAVHFKRFAECMKECEKAVKWGGTFKNLVDLPHFEI